MTRVLFLAVVVVAVFALLVRAPRARRVLWALLVVIAVYGVLKATGVVEAIAPDRNGVF